MSIKVGPIIGLSDTVARIFIDADSETEYKVEIQDPAGQSKEQTIRTSAGGTGMAEFADLTADTEYSYAVKNAKGEIVEGSQASFATFPQPGSDTNLRFAFFSCNRPFQEVRRIVGKKKVPSWLKIPLITKTSKEFIPESMQMWEELGSLVSESQANAEDSQAPRFLLGLGDQIYEEDFWNKNDAPGRAAGMSHEEIVAKYDELYRKFLSLQEIRKVTAHSPFFMTWDDHEILDGWGSRGNEHEPARQKIINAATESYNRYQLTSNPYVDPNLGYYAFVYGKIGCIMLDLRRYRSKSDEVLLGQEQWNWLEGWLQNQGKQCEVIVVGCGVPFIHLSNQLIQVRKKFWGKLLVRKVDLDDDLVDQWNSEPFVKDAKRFIELLFDFANSEGVRFVLLGGDVHVATFGVVRSNKPEHEFHPVMYNCTSSPISNKPTRVAKLLEKFAPEIELADDFPVKGRLLKIIPKRNFGIMEIKKHPQTGQYGVTFELHYQDDGEIKVQRFPTQW